MRWWMVTAMFLCLPLTAAAEVEITPYAGYRYGGLSYDPGYFYLDIVGTAYPVGAESRDHGIVGLILDVGLNPKWMLEFLVNRQDTEIEYTGLYVLDCFCMPDDLEQTTVQAGLLRRWEGQRVKPFVAFGLGLARLESTAMTMEGTPIDEDRFAASIAAGLKVSLLDWLALRLEGRSYWLDLPESLGSDLVQGELSAGLGLRW